MTWAENVPRGDLLPLNERPRFQGNWQYIRTEMRDDHYWDEESNHDGHHKTAAMTDIGDTGIALTGTDPADLPTSTEGMYYVRPKTSTEASEAAAQLSEPFYMMKSGATRIINQMGFRAVLSFRVASNLIVVNNGNNWDYQHNIATVVRNQEGQFTITFSVDMPSNRYLVLATAEGTGTSATNRRVCEVRNGTKAVGSVTIETLNSSFTRIDPSSVSILIIGG